MADIGTKLSQESLSSNDDFVNVENPVSEHSSPEIVEEEEEAGEEEEGIADKQVDVEVSCVWLGLSELCTLDQGIYMCVCGIMHCLIESCVFQGEWVKHFSVCAKKYFKCFLWSAWWSSQVLEQLKHLCLSSNHISESHPM